MSDDGPELPGSAGDTGGQRALGERRRRRLAERSGQVDLDATMSHWPVTDPPAAPRPVVRPARPTVPGVATEPVLPPPGQLVVGPLVEARRAGEPTGPTAAAGGRRSRRRAAAGPAGDVPTDTAEGPGSGSTSGAPTGGGARNILAGGSTPGSSSAATDTTGPSASPAGATPRSRRRSGPADRSSPSPSGPSPSPTPSPVQGGRRDEEGTSTPRARPAPGGAARRPRLSWPPGPLELGLAAAAVAVVLLVVALLTGLLDGQDQATDLQPSSGAATQQTSALTLTGPDGAVAAAAVLGVDSARLSTLLLPADLLLTVADAGDVPLSQAVALGPEAVRRGLEDTLLLRVDQVVLLEPSQVAALVDAAGGVVLDVGAQVVTDDVVVAAGEDQRLTGAQAVAYATLQVDGEPVETGLARFGDVLAALLEALPQEQDAAATSLAAAQVGVGAASEGAQPEALPALVATAAQRSDAGATEAVVLPTTEVTAGQADLRGVDGDTVEVALGTRFAGAQLPAAAIGDVRVVVRNGTGGSGLVGRARDLLVGAGLRYAGGGNAAQFGQEATAVLVASQEPDDLARGEAVALALGVPEDALQVNAEAMVDTDVVVVLGDDFAAATQDDPSSPTEPTTGDVP